MISQHCNVRICSLDYRCMVSPRRCWYPDGFATWEKLFLQAFTLGTKYRTCKGVNTAPKTVKTATNTAAAVTKTSMSVAKLWLDSNIGSRLEMQLNALPNFEPWSWWSCRKQHESNQLLLLQPMDLSSWPIVIITTPTVHVYMKMQ